MSVAEPGLRPAMAGLCALLVGIGLARFGYSALIPTLVEAGWFAPEAAAYLGAANLAGYLFGALGGRRMAAMVGGMTSIRWMMVLVGASFLVAVPQPPMPFIAIARFMSGFAGGVLMVLAPPAVLAASPATRRGLVGGLMLAGVGLGIACSGPVVGLLRQFGPEASWLAFGALSLFLAGSVWNLWPPAPVTQTGQPHAPVRPSAPVVALLAAYGLNAVGLVPHIVFFVDYVVRGRGLGLAVGAALWTLYGIGAAIAPILGGLVADRVGYRWTLLGALGLQLVAICAIFLPGIVPLALSAIVMGGFTPGVVPLVLGRTGEIVGSRSQAAVWRWATVLFAVGQAGAAYAFTPVFARWGYTPVFTMGAVALAAAFILAALPFRISLALRR
jgi:predicted MFS family arabinose efflux permease